MQYSVKLPKILYLTLMISKFAKESKYYNTNDLIKIANEIKPELVRLRKDKNDYKFLDDTNFGGLRGNFSTLLTLRGYIKRANRYVPYYGLGKNDRLLNAVQKGEIILDGNELIAYTTNKALKKELELQARLLLIRENQAHITKFLSFHPELGITRDISNFPKKAVVKTNNDIYYLRILFNTYISDNIIEFNMLDYLSGAKIKKFNMHPLFVVPKINNSWGKFYAIDSVEILDKHPLFVYFDIENKKFYDQNGNVYKHYCLEDSKIHLSNQSGNITERLEYSWNDIREEIVEDGVIELERIEDDEFSLFLSKFLNWNKRFIIGNKEVVDLKVSSSGGADVILQYSGGTTQKLELEHKWSNYILHQHHKSFAWKDTWLYADEKWDFEVIKKIFGPYLAEYKDNIPVVFLCANNVQKKEAYLINWDTLTYSEIEVK